VLTTDQLAAVGAFLSGVGSIFTAYLYERRRRKRAEEDCEQRIADYDRFLHEGIEIGRETHHDD